MAERRGQLRPPLTQDDIRRLCGVTLRQVKRWEAGTSNPYRRHHEGIAKAYDWPLDRIGELLARDREPPAVAPVAPLSATLGYAVGGDATKRRDAIKLGLASTLTPEILGRVLRQAAAETTEFTRRAAASSVGQATLDHLELAVADISASYSRGSPQEVFAVAHSYRRHVDELLNGPHTLAEARELYVHAGWLSETLAWVTHDLGSPLAADAYCVDAFQHADQAGHNELCAWAMDARATVALYDNRPDDALHAVLRGAEKAPAGHPLGVRLQAQAARALARLGHREDFGAAFRQALDAYDALPAVTPTRFGKGTAKLAAYAVTSYGASSYLALGIFDEARGHAELAVREHENAVERDRSPSREAIARLELAAALAGLGEPEEAARLGIAALASPRVVGSVVARAADLGRVMLDRYPQLPATHDFRDGLAAATRFVKELPA
jgi:tetratricopeptide (TPR) repeat protein